MMSTDCGNSAFPVKKAISDLPLEVIGHIFNFLTVSDIQEARLVCVDWYTASQTPAILEREKVVCTNDNLHFTPDLLLCSKRKFFHLSLMGKLDNAWYSKDFWRKFGPSLRSLSLTHSNMKDNQLLEILNHCQRLRSLEISECENLFSSVYSLSGINYPSPTLLHLQYLSIAHIYDPSNALFEKLVDCAPNLVSLSLDDCLTKKSFRKDGSQVLTYKDVVKYLRDKPHRISALLMTCYGDEDDEALSSAARLPNLHLSRLETDYSNVVAFFTCQKWLQHIELTCDVNDHLLKSICQNLPDLKHLSLPYCFNVTYSGIVELPSLKKLTSLSLLECRKVPGDGFFQGLCQNINGTLKRLAITELCLLSPLHIVALAKSHPSLKHLDLSDGPGVTDWSVQAIFRYQKSLQSLSLVRCDALTDVGLSGTKMSSREFIRGTATELQVQSLVREQFKELQCEDSEGYGNPTGCGISNLKSLQKLDLNSCSRIKGASFEKGLKLPSLRYLILDHNVRITEGAFKCLFENNRTIETLELSNCLNVQDSLIPVIVENLKRLKSIDLEDCSVSAEGIRILKQHCKRVKH